MLMLPSNSKLVPHWKMRSASGLLPPQQAAAHRRTHTTWRNFYGPLLLGERPRPELERSTPHEDESERLHAAATRRGVGVKAWFARFRDCAYSVHHRQATAGGPIEGTAI